MEEEAEPRRLEDGGPTVPTVVSDESNVQEHVAMHGAKQCALLVRSLLVSRGECGCRLLRTQLNWRWKRNWKRNCLWCGTERRS